MKIGRKILLRLPIHIIVWLVYGIFVKIPTNAIGFVVVPFLYKYRFRPYDELPWWTRPWSNLEDWIGQPNSRWGGRQSLPGWWIKRRKAKGFEGTDFRSFYRYHARRNGGDGLRSFDIFSVNLYEGNIRFFTPHYFNHYEAKVLREAGEKYAFYFAWQGWKAGWKIVYVWNDTHHFAMKFGWRIHPHHIVEGIGDPVLMEKYPNRRILYEHRGFATGLHLYRKG